MNIKGKLSLGDHIRARYLSMGGWIHYSSLFLFLVLATPYFVYVRWSTVAVILLALTAFPYLIGLPFFQWLLIKLDPSRTMYVEIEIRDNGLVWKSESGETIDKWSEFCKWRKGLNTFILFTGEDEYKTIPYHFFSSKSEALEFGKVLRSKYG